MVKEEKTEFIERMAIDDDVLYTPKTLKTPARIYG
jgi:hypothetical protein